MRQSCARMTRRVSSVHHTRVFVLRSSMIFSAIVVKSRATRARFRGGDGSTSVDLERSQGLQPLCWKDRPTMAGREEDGHGSVSSIQSRYKAALVSREQQISGTSKFSPLGIFTFFQIVLHPPAPTPTSDDYDEKNSLPSPTSPAVPESLVVAHNPSHSHPAQP